ncbi:hypothetical protein [Agarilytica rhodophyticola]|uniref:hypothetical protein n=1 Tax=Agarilytica rhodophyticola TaxID=1737490 RepID=UPI000B341CB6|nr:hypothetical protein [Agarilytica rhodophyticola]
MLNKYVTYKFFVTDGSGNQKPMDQCDFTLHPEIEPNKVWWFKPNNDSASTTTITTTTTTTNAAGTTTVTTTETKTTQENSYRLYSNLDVLFSVQPTPPQDVVAVNYDMVESEYDWKFCEDHPIRFIDSDIEHDVSYELLNNGKRLCLNITFNDEEPETLPFIFRAYYNNDPNNVVESKDPVIAIKRKPD